MLASSALTKEEVAPAIPNPAARAGGGAAGGGRDACTLALALAFRTAEQASAAEPITANLLKRWPRSQRALGLRIWTLVTLGKTADALRIAEMEVKAHPDETDASRFLAGLQHEAGKLAEAEATWTRVAASPRSNAQDHNMVAWLRLCRGDVGESTLASARRAGSRCRTGARPTCCTRWPPYSRSVTSPSRRGRCWSNRSINGHRRRWATTTAMCWGASPRATRSWIPRAISIARSASPRSRPTSPATCWRSGAWRASGQVRPPAAPPPPPRRVGALTLRRDAVEADLERRAACGGERRRTGRERGGVERRADRANRLRAGGRIRRR